MSSQTCALLKSNFEACSVGNLDTEGNDLTNLITNIADLVPGVIYQYKLYPDGRSCFPYASNAIRQIYRVRPEDVKKSAAAIFEILHPDDAEVVKNSIQISANTLTLWNHEYRVKFPNGDIRWLHGNAMPIRNEDGSILWHGFITDISDRKALEEANKMLYVEQQILIDNELVGIVKLEGTRICWANKATLKIFGYTNSELEDLNIVNFFANSTQFNKLQVAASRAFRNHHVYRTQLEMFKSDGNTFWVDLNGAYLPNHPTASMWMMTDITSLKTREFQITEIAFHDPLTGLPNRLLIFDRLKQAMSNACRRHQKLFVCYLDLDGFKPVNDKFGHEIGDLVLKNVAKRLLDSVRPNDIVGRIGGDEFILLLPVSANYEGYQTVLNRVVMAIQTPIFIRESIKVQLGACIGTSVFPDNGDDSITLVRQADQAMYQAKKLGRNHIRSYENHIH